MTHLILSFLIHLLSRSAAKALNFDDIPAESWKSVKWDRLGDTSGISIEELFMRRHLQEAALASEEPLPPQRECGYEIGTATSEDIKGFIGNVVSSLLGNASGAAAMISGATIIVSPVITHSVRAQVLCGSCAEIMELYAGEDFLSANGKHSFLSYCGPDKHGYNASHSALLLVPLNSDAGDLVPGQLKTSVTMHTTTISQKEIPSQVYPADLNSAFDLNADLEVKMTQVQALYDIIAGVIAASSGVTSIVPDYIGYGHSYQYPRSYAVAYLYQQAATVSWLKAKKEVENMSTGCTTFKKAVTIGGYSEGGYGALAAALAYQAMEIDVIGVSAGGAAYDISGEIQFAMNQLENVPNVSHLLSVLVPLVGNSYSSTNADLVNTDSGQNALAPEWMIKGNFTRNVLAWLNSTQTLQSLYELMPEMPFEILNAALVNATRASIAANSSSFCVAGVLGDEINLLCDAFESNSLVEELLAVTFKYSVCQSPNDTIVLPLTDISSNPNISLLDLIGTKASGDHFKASYFCLLGTIIPFTSLNSFGETKDIVPLKDASTCKANHTPSTGRPSPSPTNALTSLPTPAPKSDKPASGVKHSAPSVWVFIVSIFSVRFWG
jgi:pimeloyl-ACP methyl ester carboxylesterase